MGLWPASACGCSFADVRSVDWGDGSAIARRHHGCPSHRTRTAESAHRVDAPSRCPEVNFNGDVTDYPSQPRRASTGGLEARARAAITSHEGWTPARRPARPGRLARGPELTREPDLVPVRHGRMMVSPFTFYRGAAKIMAADLKDTPTAGLGVQLCGDAHLSNFGGFASPERRLLFDLNDFDETLPGPVRVRREADGGQLHDRRPQQRLRQGRRARGDHGVGAAYREAMASFAQMRTMDIWYSHLGEEDILPAARRRRSRARRRRRRSNARRRTSARPARTTACRPCRSSPSGRRAYRIVSQPPIVVPLRDPRGPSEYRRRTWTSPSTSCSAAYRATLQPDRRHLLERFELVEAPARSSASAVSEPGR